MDHTEVPGAEFDVSQYEIEDTATLTVQNLRRTDDLLGPNGQPVKITIYSPGSKQGVKALHKMGQAAQLRMMAAARGKIDKDDALQAQENLVAKLVGITVSIENFPIPGGARALYSNPKLADIAGQVDEFFNLASNFSKGDTVTSPSTSDN